MTAELARSALNSGSPSLFSKNVLYRWGLTEVFRRNPEAALDILHERLRTARHPGATLFALAELCFNHAEDTGRREYDLAAALFAYAYLFPNQVEDRPERFDPRLRIAADLYNRALTRGFASSTGGLVVLGSGVFPLPFGQQLSVVFDESSLLWANRRLYDFVPVAELEVRGLGARFRNPGLGAPLAASMQPLEETAPEWRFVPPEMKVPVTALLRIDDPRAQATRPVVESTLRLYNRYETADVQIVGERVPLEAEPSATLAYGLSRSRIWRFERLGILRGDLVSSEIERPLTFLEPYRPGRIPVVFVHGTGSSPGRWADMINVLANDRRLRGRFQFWFFFYDSGNAIPYSALRLRQSLTEAVERLDPEHRDPALQQMVIIGHSQGGLLAKMTAIESGDRFWNGISSRPIDELNVSDEARDLLRQVFVFEPLPFVRRLVFLATPHRGSALADSSFATLLGRFVQLPQTLAGATSDLITGNPDALRFDPRRPVFGSVYGMRSGSVLLAELAETPVAAGVTGHSIIPVRGDLPPYGQSDGVVRYESAHLDWVASELVLPRSGHSVQRNPLAIEEVRRILVEHADRVCDERHVACAARSPERVAGDRFPVDAITVELEATGGGGGEGQGAMPYPEIQMTRARDRASERRATVPALAVLPPAWPAAAEDPAPLMCFGSEPSWGLALERPGQARLDLQGAPASTFRGAATARPTAGEWVWRGRASAGSGDLVAFLRNGPCSDDMSDVRHPVTAFLSLPDGRVLAGCCRILTAAAGAGEGSPANRVPIEGKTWRLTSGAGGDAAFLAAVPEGVTLRFSEGALQAFAGCNRLHGSYTVDGDRVTLGTMAGTMMACPPEIATVEDAVVRILTGTQRLAVAGDTLTLSADSGSTLTFTLVTLPELDGTSWTVTGYNNGRQAVVSPLPGTVLTLAFRDGGVSGSAGCNTFRASYMLEGERLAIGPAATTRRACSGRGVTEQERQYLTAIESVTTWAIDREHLDLHRADGERALTAKPSDPAPSKNGPVR